MTEELRSCRRAGCRWPAAASLSFRYDTRQAWLLDLAREPHPSLYDLCPHHADRLTVPNGWERVDGRSTRPPVHEPAASARELRLDAEESHRHDRYETLREELPRLAAALRDD